ncbi:hypothetical protein J416_03096 [Gracilibacillus halophilus YIM-C55.5]|uniref:Methyl-accepting chemotaxis protein n=1 Tax=Gracilibacillus halophilus YIM-C55.5 TaxID=1308866 RepID=N4WXV7_9BACI|nr:methyl-accepting chemotaxis protein [Gracilibacillus halophilus]ENH97906.1 hypothetical protein J416_03096 [Gracilibacillus halophilus YIM-C55.5]
MFKKKVKQQSPKQKRSIKQLWSSLLHKMNMRRSRKSENEHSASQVWKHSNVNRKHSISTKMSISILATVFASVLIVGVSSYIISNNIIKSKVTGASEQTVIQTGDKLDFMIQRYRDRVTEILMADNFRDTLLELNTFENANTNNFDYFSQKQIIDDELAAISTINTNITLHLLNVDKERIISSTEGAPQAAFFDSDWYDSAVNTKGTYWIGGKKSGVSDNNSNATVSFAQTLNINGSNFMLIMELAYPIFQDALADVRFGENGLARVVDTNNEVVFSFNEEEIGKPYQYEIAIDSEKNMVERKGQLVFQHNSQASDLYLVGSVPESELTKDTQIIFIVTVIIILLSLLFSLLFARRIVKTIARPISNISGLMQVAEDGDLRVRSDQANRKDEIGELSNSFNHMLENISEMMNQTRSSSTKVLDAAVELTDIAQSQSQSAKEVASASEEISSGATGLTDEAERGNTLASTIYQEVENVYNNNTEMQDFAKEVVNGSYDGLEKMNQLVTKTKDSETMTNALSTKVDTLKNSTEQINQVMEMLTDIAQQTNLLSLNAAIEAARAGESGKGFAVVADEIRKLSTQSKNSIDKVEEITNEIVNEVDDTLQVLEEATPRFSEQVQQAEDTQSILNNVGERMGAFDDKIAEVTESIKQLRNSQDTLTSTIQQVSATAEESSAISEEVSASTEEQLNVTDKLVSTSDELKELSEQLQEMMKRFQV